MGVEDIGNVWAAEVGRLPARGRVELDAAQGFRFAPGVRDAWVARYRAAATEGT